MRRASLVLLLLTSVARADDTTIAAVGGIAGVTLGPQEYFPTYLAGAAGGVDFRVVRNLSLGLVGRLQTYTHPEDEDFGSWGFQGDLSAELRLDAFDIRASRGVNPFLAIRAGVAFVDRIPFDSSGSELIGGTLFGAALGIDIASEGKRKVRVQLAYDHPSFTTHDDIVGPVGELSLSVMGVFP